MDSNGLLCTLDPNLPIHEQINLLRYDVRWEIPLDCIDFGSLLGQGAFGKGNVLKFFRLPSHIQVVVYKAKVFGVKNCPKAYAHRGRVNRETCGMTAAVKMLKNHSTINQLKSLLSELKVLNYIGCHVNVVNLLAACTANLIKGELYVVVEYCSYGNLQRFLSANRHRFVPIQSTSQPSGRQLALDIFQSVERQPPGPHLEQPKIDLDPSLSNKTQKGN